MVRFLIAVSFLTLSNIAAFNFGREATVLYRDRVYAGTYAVIHQGGVRYASPGDVATGRLLREESKELDLDTSPCAGTRVVRFREPYEKSMIGQLTCGQGTCDKVQVRQK
jgi:hypothetical protein